MVALAQGAAPALRRALPGALAAACDVTGDRADARERADARCEELGRLVPLA